MLEDDPSRKVMLYNAPRVFCWEMWPMRRSWIFTCGAEARRRQRLAKTLTRSSAGLVSCRISFHRLRAHMDDENLETISRRSLGATLTEPMSSGRGGGGAGAAAAA